MNRASWAITLCSAALAFATPAASADTVTSNGCVYHTETYAQAVDLWFAAGTPFCGAVYSVSVDTTVSGTVDPIETPDRSSWG